VDPTGERLVPDAQRGELIYAEHLARYRLAAQYVSGRRVLDAGCGDGYGTALLASAGAASVVGVDIDEATIAHARERYGHAFEVADVAELPFDDGSFDFVVCFETIEHVSDSERALAELRRVLVDDGLLAISTPNRLEYLVENEFHVREFSPEEFTSLLDPYFPERAWLYQQNWLLSAILREDGLRTRDDEPLDISLAKASGLEPGRELYSVVLCGPVERAPRAVGVVSSMYEAHRLAEELSAWQHRSELSEQQRAEWEKRATIAESQIEPWRERATTAERQRASWEERALEAERQVGETRAQLADAERALEGLLSSLSWRLTSPLRSMSGRIRPPRN
jgi:SAM-dependent methyltransferase